MLTDFFKTVKYSLASLSFFKFFFPSLMHSDASLTVLWLRFVSLENLMLGGLKTAGGEGNEGSDIKKRHNMKVEISLSSAFLALIFSFGYNLAAFRMTSAVSIKLSGFALFFPRQSTDQTEFSPTIAETET